MKTSVIMPLFNKEEFLEEAVGSILNQSHSDYKLIIVDDCSTDNSYEIAKKIKEQDSRIELYRMNKNQGVSKVVNYAVRNCDTEYFMRMDADDISQPQRLETLLNAQTYSNADVVGSRFSLMAENNIIPDGLVRFEKFSNSICNEDDIKKYFTVMPTVLQGTMLVKTNVYKTHPQNSNYDTAEDYEQLGRWIKANIKIVKCEESLLKYRYLKHSLSNTNIELQLINNLNIKINHLFDVYLNKEILYKFFIWGTSQHAIILKRILDEHEIKSEVSNFISFDENDWGTELDLVKCCKPEIILKRNNCTKIIVIWNKGRDDITSYLSGNNFKHNIDYFIFS